jgi:hypothetical protein
LKDKEHLGVLIIFGKYKLWFQEIRLSKFEEDWIIGVDKKPFSEEFCHTGRSKKDSAPLLY